MNSIAEQILIIDDEPDIRELLEITLTRMGKITHSAESIQRGKQLLAEHDFDLCLTDMRLPDGNGIELIKYIARSHPQTPVAMITAHGNMESAIEALKAGAFDFISKPVDLQTLRNLITTALKLTGTDNEKFVTEELQLLGECDVMQTMRKTINKLARSQAPVYVSGESGVGKELVARMIHAKGPRQEKPFIPVNCGAIPAELMESEFFGHKKGSFTGAVNDKEGLFLAAEGGTLFLDEVADLPLHMQVKLLRAIQEKAIRVIGSNDEVPINVRILSATHKDLGALVQQNQFRQDLYYRINVIELQVPALRERTEDIPVLVTHFIQRIANEWEIETPRLAPSAIKALQEYAFPGNIRELENILERAMTLCENDTITEHELHLPEPVNGETDFDKVKEEAYITSLSPALDSKERKMITQALEKTRYNKTAAAKLLGITFRQLRYRLKKLGIE